MGLPWAGGRGGRGSPDHCGIAKALVCVARLAPFFLSRASFPVLAPLASCWPLRALILPGAGLGSEIGAWVSASQILPGSLGKPGETRHGEAQLLDGVAAKHAVGRRGRFAFTETQFRSFFAEDCQSEIRRHAGSTNFRRPPRIETPFRDDWARAPTGLGRPSMCVFSSSVACPAIDRRGRRRAPPQPTRGTCTHASHAHAARTRSNSVALE